MSISIPISNLNCNLMKAKYAFIHPFCYYFFYYSKAFATFHSPLIHSNPLHFSTDGFSSFIFLPKLTVSPLTSHPNQILQSFFLIISTPQPLTIWSHLIHSKSKMPLLLIALGQYFNILYFNYFSDHLTFLLVSLFLNQFSLLTCKQFIATLNFF